MDYPLVEHVYFRDKTVHNESLMIGNLFRSVSLVSSGIHAAGCSCRRVLKLHLHHPTTFERLAVDQSRVSSKLFINFYYFASDWGVHIARGLDGLDYAESFFF